MTTQNISLSTADTTLNATRNVARISSSFDPVDVLARTKPVRTLAEMYTGLMEEEITPRFTLHLVNVQVAAFVTIMPAAMPLFMRVLCLLWFATSLCLAKREYNGK